MELRWYKNFIFITMRFDVGAFIVRHFVGVNVIVRPILILTGRILDDHVTKPDGDVAETCECHSRDT